MNYHFQALLVLGSKVDKPSNFLIKTLNIEDYIESDIQKMRYEEYMILSSSMYEKTYLHGSLERVLEAIEGSSI